MSAAQNKSLNFQMIREIKSNQNTMKSLISIGIGLKWFFVREFSKTKQKQKQNNRLLYVCVCVLINIGSLASSIQCASNIFMCAVEIRANSTMYRKISD